MAIDRERVESIFDAAVALGSAAERASYLDSACGQDAERVEALLAAHDGSGSFLAHPLVRPAPGSPPRPLRRRRRTFLPE